MKLMEEIQKIENENNEINMILNNSISFLEKGYLLNKNSYEIIPAEESIINMDFRKSIRVIHLEKFAYEKNENIIDKLSNIYTALYSNSASVFLILNSDGKKCDFYIGVKSEEDILQAYSILTDSLKGNFSGIEFLNIDNRKTENLIFQIFEKNISEISTVIGIPSLKQENKEKFLQGIEKLINGMEGKEFSALFIADPIKYNKLKEVQKSYEELYNQLIPFVNFNVSLNESKAVSLMKGISKSFGKIYSETLSRTESTSKTFSKGQSSSFGKNIGLYYGYMSPGGGPMGGGNIGISSTVGESSSESNTRGASDTAGSTYGENKLQADNESTTNTDTIGRTIQFTQKNKIIEDILQKIEKHLERVKLGEGNGWWNTGVYFISEKVGNAITAANIYNGLVRGKNSNVEKNGVYVFSNNNSDLKKLTEYLVNFSNPQIFIKNFNIDAALGSLITTEELSLKMNFPRTTIYGLDVLEMATFGKNFLRLMKII